MRNFNIRNISLVFLTLSLIFNAKDLKAQSEVVLSPANGLMTATINGAIEKCAASGGGTVKFTRGIYHSGTLELKNNITLHLEKGAILKGSDKYADYTNDAFIFGKGLNKIAITGEGVIDGVDCYNPKGEEGFRGPHCVRLINCENIVFRGFAITRSANWALNCRYCRNGIVDKVTIRGGHDGLHTRFCEKFTVTGCDFRTGDDAFAGNDNRDFSVADCKINSSCNGFRFGCLNLVVKNCYMWGPGEFKHRISNRTNMSAAFVHFSPSDENPKLPSGNWLIENVTIENADYVYMYNIKGLWQTGQPAGNITFNNIKASGMLNAFTILGDKEKNLNLTIQNSTFSFREGATKIPSEYEGAENLPTVFFNATNFNSITIGNSTFIKKDTSAIFYASSGNSLVVEKTELKNNSADKPYQLVQIENVKWKED